MNAHEADLDALEFILELADLIAEAIAPLDAEEFVQDRNTSDLVAYRLGTIGEATRRLSNDLKARHSQIPWRAIYALRNVVAHDYRSLIPRRIWDSAAFDLPELAEICRLEQRRLTDGT